jgi:small-conductance mechanosensitive channel
MMLLDFQQTSVPARPFDPNIVWQVFSQLLARLMAHLPYLILGFVVFVFFIVGARLAKSILNTAGRRTRLDRTLADLLGRLVSAFTIILGLFVAAVIIFPTFNPGDLIAGLGITSVAIGFAFKDVLQNFFAGILILWRRPFIVGDEIKSQSYEGTAPSVFVAELAPSSVNLNVFFWTNSRQASLLRVSDGAMTGIKLALDEAGIDIPYPHTVVLNQPPTTCPDGASPANC